MSAPAPRPRLLIALALVSILYGTVGTVTAWSTLLTLTGSHDRFVSAVEKDASRVLGVDKQLGTPEQMQKVATRKAEALWARRGVLLPLAGASAISALLILLGSIRTVARPGRRAWGRAAWQLGALVAIPCVIVETMVGYFHSRDLVAAVADLHDPLSDQLRALLPLRDKWGLLQAGISSVFLLSVAAYLASAKVQAYANENEGA